MFKISVVSLISIFMNLSNAKTGKAMRKSHPMSWLVASFTLILCYFPCRKMMSCNYCHGWKELEFHPLLYKTKPCPNSSNCDKKDCIYYHNLNEKKKIDELASIKRIHSLYKLWKPRSHDKKDKAIYSMYCNF